MSKLKHFIHPCRVLFSLEKPVLNCGRSVLFTYSFSCNLCSTNTIYTPVIMSQRKITNFFTKTPLKSSDKSDGTEDRKEEKTLKNSPDESQTKKLKGISDTRPVKRQRIESSGSDTQSPVKKTPSPEFSPEKKTVKRRRIVSSSSESQSPVKKTPSPEVEKKKTTKRQRIDSSDSDTSSKETQKQQTKSEEKIPKSNSSPKTKKSKTKPLLEQNGDKDKKTKKGNSKIKKIEEKQTAKSQVKDEENISVKKEEKGKKNESKENIALVSETDYNPSKASYDPIKDACWSRGQEVPYLALAKTLEAIEGTSARLKIVQILSNYFRSVIVLTPEDLLPSVYMCLNQLAPAYHSLELGIAETYLMKAIGQSTGRTLGQMKSAVQKYGDLGLVAEQARSTQKTMFTPPPLKARRVFNTLKEIAHMTGQSSVTKKIGKIQTLYVACRQSESRYLIRSLAGKLRIGLAEQSVLQALSLAVTQTPPGQVYPPQVLDAAKGRTQEQFKAVVDENALTIKTTYCACPNYEMLIPVVLKHGVSALPDHCRLTPGIPLKPMLAHPTKGVHEVFNRFEGVEFTCEWKYDGERAQIHVPEGPDYNEASVFSRNQENNTTKYPDIIRRLPSLLKDTVKSCVLDCEAVAYDVENHKILPFQILSTRKRKDASESEIKVQVCVYVFDLLYLNGESLVTQPLEHRRTLLREHFHQVPGEWEFATWKDCTSLEEVQQFLDEAVKGSCEGLMVKTLSGKDATYEIAKRSHNWLKLKKDYLDGVGDTLDVVVIGGYVGKGKRTGVYGGFLLACYDPDSEEYQSICKIGTGFSDDNLQHLSHVLNEHVLDGPRGYYRFDSSHAPDTWFSPSQVWEIRCADLSLSPAHRAGIGLVDPDKGISLRFPRFVRVRDDKTPELATSAQQVAEMYLSQDQVKNQTNNKNVDDDFY